MDEIEQLRESIATLESQRVILGDAVVDAAVSSMREKLAALELQAIRRESTRRRKVITVLFAEISLEGSELHGAGSPADWHERADQPNDAEDLSEWMDVLWTGIDATIEAHGGKIDKHMGDTVMAIWGAETTREDDAARAIRAALDMQRELANFCRQRKMALEMSIGISTGPALLGSVGSTREFTALGDTVNVAARLEQAALPGQILVSHDTCRVAGEQFHRQAVSPLVIKGKSQPVQCYLIEAG